MKTNETKLVAKLMAAGHDEAFARKAARLVSDGALPRSIKTNAASVIRYIGDNEYILRLAR